jgi:uncharacterized membrane protein
MFPADYKKQKIMDALIQENEKVIYRNQIVCLFVCIFPCNLFLKEHFKISKNTTLYGFYN